MLNPRHFLADLDAGILTLTLNRPDKLNALTFEVYAELRDTFLALERDREVKVVILTGAGRGFCSGGDVTDIIGELVRREPAEVLDFARMTCDVIRAMRALRRPVIAAINGVAAGAGAVLALASDFRIMAEGARFAFLFTKVGLAGSDMGASFLLPRVVGLGRATEMLMLGEPVPAEQALAAGLCTRVVPAGELLTAARDVARRLAAGPGLALGVTKEMLNATLSMSLHDALDEEARAQALCMTMGDFREFSRAFEEKRAPVFRGR
ncbi:MAG: enoyl-CoA hydratase family protein [Deltaproteobacteria bacterium]|nr:enoyl-CoA hydratase family protein [Deltaproteobacteria bacterium]